MDSLKGKFIAIVATDGAQEEELLEPMNAMMYEGATCHIIAPHGGEIRTWRDRQWTKSIPVQLTFEGADPKKYDALFIPGGTINCDSLRTEREAVEFTRSFFEDGKPVGAICHGPQLLIEAGVTEGREMTSFHAIQTDLKNAGAIWKNEAVVVDDGLVTSRTPLDLPVFIRSLIQEIGNRP